MIELYSFPGAWGHPSLSPFCTKVEAYLKMVGIPYRVKLGDPRKGPKGKLPYIVDGDEIVADSHYIILYLKERYGDILDRDLTPVQRGIGHSVVRMLEEHFYWVGIFSRWIAPEGWTHLKPVIDGLIPPLVRSFILPAIRKKLKRALDTQGIGRHSGEDIYRRGLEDLEAVSEIMGDNLYLLGDSPTSYDASVMAFLQAALEVPIENPITEAYRKGKFSNFRRYLANFREKFF